MYLYKMKQKQNPTDGYEISENHWGEKEKMKQWEMKSWEKWNLLIRVGFKQLQHPCKNNGQKAAEKGVIEWLIVYLVHSIPIHGALAHRI